MRSPVAPACTVRVSVVLTLQPRDEQEPCAGRDIFGSRKLAGTPEPGSSWSLSGRTEEDSLDSAGSSNSRVADTDVTAEGAGSHSLLWSLTGQGSPPHTGPETIAGHKSPWFRAGDSVLTPTAAPGEQLFCGERNHQ